MPLTSYLHTRLHQAAGLADRWTTRYPWLMVALSFVPSFYLSYRLLYLLVWAGVFGVLPGEKELKSVKSPVASEVISIDGVVLGRYFTENRSPVELAQVSPHLIQALIATEDVRFYRHDGVDLFSMPRVFFKTLLLGDESSGGGSTITQQLAKNLYPRREYGWFSLPINKIREAILARRLEGVYSKEEILKHYLNTVPFGDNAYGIEVACRRFFSVSAADILPQDAALLVGMLKATSAYNPRTDPARSVQRRNVVLRQMYRNGACTQAFADSLAALPVALNYQPESHNLGLAPYFRERLRQELDRWCKSYTRPDGSHPNLYTDGLKIYVTIHSRMQQYAEEAVAEHMKKVQQRFDAQWKGKGRLKESEKQVSAIWERSARYRQLKTAGASVQELDSACLRPVRMQVFTWQGPRDTLLSPRDSILHSEYMLHAGFMALDPASGHVRAWVGGIQHAFYQYDHVDSRRQCGSVFKPFVYAAALESGISPCEYISNERTTFEGYGNWAPRNADSDYGGEYSMESALTHSVNVVTVNLLMQTGIPKVTDLARRLGLQGELPETPALALGAGQASLREMVAAYAAFVNGGQHVTPQYLLRVEDANGTLLKGMEQIAVGPQVLSDSTALLIRHMLTSVVDRGTAHGLRSRFGLKGQMAGKTGTTQSQADGWFIGVTPGLAAGAWVGANNPAIHFQTLLYGQGAATALPIWGGFVKKLHRDPEFAYMQKEKFPALPEDVLALLDCDLGNLPLSMSAFREWWESQQDTLQRE